MWLIGVIGGGKITAQATSKLHDLANLMDDDDDFMAAFTKDDAVKKVEATKITQAKRHSLRHENDHIETLLA